VATDFSLALVPGPWEHRFVSAAGARFHAAVAGPAGNEVPLVVLLHGFPQFWWTWRHQITALAAAGYRVAALDLRGYAASDKPSGGNDLPTLARDTAAVIASLGASRAVVAGQGLGGMVAWTMTAYCPAVLQGIAVLGAAHPVGLSRNRALPVSPRAVYQMLGVKAPGLPEWALRNHDVVGRVLATWSAAGWADREAAELYRDMLRVPFAASKAVDQLRWALSSPISVEHRRFAAQFAEPANLPLLHLQGNRDGLIRSTAVAEPKRGGPSYEFALVEGAGHFLTEEAPEAVSALLLDWLARTGNFLSAD